MRPSLIACQCSYARGSDDQCVYAPVICKYIRTHPLRSRAEIRLTHLKSLQNRPGRFVTAWSRHLVVDVDPLGRLLKGDGIRLRRLEQHPAALLVVLEPSIIGRGMVMDL